MTDRGWSVLLTDHPPHNPEPPLASWKDRTLHTHFAAIAAPDQLSLARRLDAHTVIFGDDWIFEGARTWNGYAVIATTGKKVARAHRVAFVIAHGPIPAGLHIDHVWKAGCRDRACIKPDHLEAISQRRNNQRSAEARRLRNLSLAA